MSPHIHGIEIFNRSTTRRIGSCSSRASWEALRQQRWDDHRYYHHSRINQTLHLVSAISFVCAYVIVFWDPAVAALIGWLFSMTTRQAGHFFFEPKGYDRINDEGQLDRVEAIILSMTPGERADPASINGSRRKRIANGSGTKVQHVKQLVKQFDQMRTMMKQMATGQAADPAADRADAGAVRRVRDTEALTSRRPMAVRNQTQKGGFEEEPDLADRRRRQTLAA